jgi:integrase
MTSSEGTAKDRSEDLRDIRQRGPNYQVRVFTGYDPVTGKQVFLAGSAPTKRAAIKLRNQFRGEVAASKSTRTGATLAHLLREWLDSHDAAETTLSNYRWLAETFVIPALGNTSLTKLVRVGPKAFEQLYAELRRCRRRCKGAGTFVEHRTPKDPECDKRCKPHECVPLAATSIRKIHAVLSGAFSAAVRWGWVSTNPLDATIQPKAPRPQPSPPTTEQAARIVEAAWKQDYDWGIFVWLTFVTGARRGELIALQWNDLDLASATLNIRRGLVRPRWPYNHQGHEDSPDAPYRARQGNDGHPDGAPQAVRATLR